MVHHQQVTDKDEGFFSLLPLSAILGGMDNYDVAIIGAGVVGCAIARNLSRTNAKVVVFEREADVAFATSGRNSGVVHSGIHYTPGSLRAILNVAGNAALESVCKELSVPFQRIGKLTVAFNDTQINELERLKRQGEANGVPNLRLLDPQQMRAIQPGVAGIKALYSPSTGIVNPMALTIALAEHAHHNEVVFKFLHEVKAITFQADSSIVISCLTTAGTVKTKASVVVNCAGLHAAEIAAMSGWNEHPVYPCRGEYYVLDNRLKDELSALVYPVPSAHSGGLGIHLTKTTEGNILIGPSNEYIEDNDDTASTRSIMDVLKQEGSALLPSLATSDFIRSFAGLRPKLTPPAVGGYRDFIIAGQPGHDNIIHLMGIESPGLTSAVAIADRVRDMIRSIIELKDKKDWKPTFTDGPGIYRRPYPLSHYPLEERLNHIATDADFGTIVCRCEQISKAEILSAAKRIFGPVTIVGIKNRCRISTGRCQGGFCLPRIVTLLHDELGMPLDEIVLKGPQSALTAGALRLGGSGHVE
jgi:glycerol-3-phosphate dehydrogenase